MQAGDGFIQRVITTEAGQFVEALWNGTNEAGWGPLCDKVLILVDEAASKTAGGIIRTDEGKELTSLSATTGILVAAGPQAFAYDSQRLTQWVGERPVPGSRVAFQKYSGETYTGDDGRLYRIMEDRSVAMVRLPRAEVKPAAKRKAA